MNKNINHVAIIMDGNRRWAVSKNKPKHFGHKAGMKSVMNAINSSIYFKLKALTLYAFSNENWNRSEKEVLYLMNLFMYSLKNKINELHKKNIKLNIIGDKKKFNKKLQKYIHNSEKITENNTGLILNIAVNYSGKWDIKQCLKKIIKKVQKKKINVNDINEFIIDKYMSINNNIPVDLIIRTGGELRISNFLLWQMAYSELYFTKILWPDFNKNMFREALISFYKRTRRFGI